MIGVFLVLHGLVYLLYSGHSRRLFELRPDTAWPDGSWAFSKLLGDEVTRTLASVSYILVAIGFVAGGIGLLTGQSWWRPVVIDAAAISVVLIVLFWDGEVKMLGAKGGIGLLINLAILVALLITQWPHSGV